MAQYLALRWRQTDIGENACRRLTQQPDLFQRGPILGCGLQIDLCEPLEDVALVLGEGKDAGALAKLLERRAVKDKAIYAVMVGS